MPVERVIRDLYRKVRGRPMADEVPSDVALAFAFHRGADAVRGTVRSFASRRVSVHLRGRRVQVRTSRMLTVGKWVCFGDDVVIDAFSRNGVTIGDYVTVGRGASILGSGVIANPGEGISIGEGTSIGSFNVIWGQGGVTIGENCLFGPNVVVVSENHRIGDLDLPIRLQGEDRAPVGIGDNCWLGANVVVTAGVTIGSGAVIGAGSVVVHDVPENAIVVGAPARVVRQRG
ncbi:acyltransferase [Smaragdicoccus niigatensis]|uniref:acyltransferase n=1 Tax=Smaragdicoccus niigatensis TaxID=359359 RepID=UPI0003A7D94F|nr:acyltransferase [Smaragdicoccus niigatensis]